jgi:biopolymer transport protein ExbD
MKKHLIKTIGCIAAAITFAGCLHSPNTTAQEDRQQPVAISIAPNGELSVAGEQCRQSELTGRLTELAAKRQTAVLVRADARAPYTQVVAVMDACKAAGMQQVSLAATK